MPKEGTLTKKIVSKALELLLENPEGIRFSELERKVEEACSDINPNTVYTIISELNKHVKDVYKPARGLYRHKKYDTEQKEITTGDIKIKEQDFYQPFSDWLKKDIEECTRAEPLGGKKFGNKWGTPDVIGVNEGRKDEIIKFNEEVVSAEIKINTNDLITAFGQACSYLLFSHKSYLVIPKSSSSDDISRLDSLCSIVGIGLVLFDSNNVKDPQFQIKTRPIKKEPDRFYTNQNIAQIHDLLWGNK